MGRTTFLRACTVVFFALAAAGAVASADDRATALAGNRAALEAYFADHVADLADTSALPDTSADNWPEQRERYRRQLAYMLGLDPMPERSPLNAEVTGTFEHDDFTVEKLHFQAQPGLYVTANLYVPHEIDAPAPAILYLCGHARRVRDGVSLGNKTAYQHHPAWFARHGYVSLVVDTIQLGEIPGHHHGTHNMGLWWWNSRGYTPAGVEAFNAMRAIDYLETRDEVDASRIGVTGRSGGGIGTLYVAALDGRIAAAAPVAGITDIHNHVADFLTPRHCDCNYFPNIYRFDYGRIVSLIAPRPLLIANTDRDPIFPLDGVQRVHAEVADLYRSLGVEEDIGLAVAVGGHSDTQPLRVPVFDWFNRHLKDDDALIREPAEQFTDEADLRVFDDLPEDETVTTIHETFVAEADVEKPETVEDWQEQRERFLAALQRHTFRNWPEQLPPFDVERALAAESEGIHLEAWDFTVEEHVRLRLYTARAADADPQRIFLRVVDEEGWEEGLAALRVGFADVLPEHPQVAPDREVFDRVRRHLESGEAVFAMLAPRGIGPAAWAEADDGDATHLRRSFPIIGQTLDGQRVLDVLRTLQGLREHAAADELPITLLADRDMAGVAVYAAALDQDVDALHLRNPPTTHHDGVELLNVLRFMDMPQALALAAEHSLVVLTTDEPQAWAYPRHVAELLGRSDQFQVAEE